MCFSKLPQVERVGWVAFIAPTLLLVVFNLHILPERIQPNVQGTTVVNLSFFSLDLNFILIFYLIGWGYILQRRSCNVPIIAVLFILTIVLYGRLTSIPNVMMYIIMIASMFIFSARKHAKKITLLFLLTLFIIIAVMLLLSGSSYYLSRLSIVLHLGKIQQGQATSLYIFLACSIKLSGFLKLIHQRDTE